MLIELDKRPRGADDVPPKLLQQLDLRITLLAPMHKSEESQQSKGLASQCSQAAAEMRGPFCRCSSLGLHALATVYGPSQHPENKLAKAISDMERWRGVVEVLRPK